MEVSNCLPCAHPGNYPADAIRWMKQENKLCEKHLEKAQGLLEKQNKPLAYKDREPGSDDV